MKTVEHDALPKEVAIELLTDPHAKMTNRMRKNCRDALSTYYVSEAAKKPLAKKFSARLADWSFMKLVRAQRRVEKKRRGIQRKYEVLVRQQPKNPIIEARIALIDLHAGVLDSFLDCAADEMDWRQQLVRGEVDGEIYCPVMRVVFCWDPGCNHWVGYHRTGNPAGAKSRAGR